ncbi:CDP-alcohol phosphatidyltransferase family protein [Aurantiacibacter sp. MUD11]|uniref:CDP-alcohol phosphatidyltransferase family protein n=1 Tax=Aurantiacibacter sp. MUD11 TaxID=3003265 RepID=UPI0022AB49F8|nr:CDP-alcohol phosphatidyltransferase family protein [Aurantiacibacter sp. MUD11]WAT16910.1 CDP-alcohol phosphatidyltransferase family protein [Aurantiacibacter sp. MUD11]
MEDPMRNRRVLKTRQAGWAQALAKALGSMGLTPNAISTIGVLFAALGAAAFMLAPENPHYWLGAAAGIQLRLLANMLDGLVAVEGGKKSATGPLFNEVPDRIEDALLLVAAGYACGIPELGYGATILAFGTAYVRATGGALGFDQDFSGPMAKQHRMFVLTLGAVVAFALDMPRAVEIALVFIAVGSALTCLTRTWAIARQLQAKGA